MPSSNNTAIASSAEAMFLLRSSSKSDNGTDPKPYTYQYHSDLLRIQKEPPSVWYSIDLTHHLLSTTASSAGGVEEGTGLDLDDDVQEHNKQEEDSLFSGSIKEYCFAMTECHRWYHGMAAAETTTMTTPVRTISIRIRPDVLCGAVMDAIYFVLDDMGSEIRKRQGGHLKAAIYCNNNEQQTSTTEEGEEKEDGSSSSLCQSYDLDAQLCVSASPKCERVLLIRIYHPSEQTIHEQTTKSNAGFSASQNNNSGEDENDDGMEDILANYRREQEQEQRRQQKEKSVDHRHCANLHLREACALIRWSKKCQPLQIPVSLQQQQQVPKEDSKSSSETGPEPELLEPELEPEQDVAEKCDTDRDPEPESEPGARSSAKVELEEGPRIEPEESSNQEPQSESQFLARESTPDPDIESEPNADAVIQEANIEQEAVMQAPLLDPSDDDAAKAYMEVAQPYVSSYLLQNYLAFPSVLDDESSSSSGANNNKNKKIATSPSLSPKDWPVICASWDSITSIWEELQDRELTYASLRDSRFGNFPALPTLDVQYCSQLEMFSRQEMTEQLTIHEAELERYAEQEETTSYRGWALLSSGTAAKSYKVQLPDKPVPLPLESYPLDFVPPQNTCPPWGGKVMEAMNRVAAMSHNGEQQQQQQMMLQMKRSESSSLFSQKIAQGEEEKSRIINGEAAIKGRTDPLLSSLPPLEIETYNNYRHSLSMAEAAVQLVWAAFQAQHGEEQSAYLDRKNAQVIDRLANMEAHQRKCVKLLANCTNEEATHAADEFLARVQPEKLTDRSCTVSNAARREVPLFTCNTRVGTLTGTCYVTSSQILCTTTKWMTKGHRRSTLFSIQQVDLEILGDDDKKNIVFQSPVKHILGREDGLLRSPTISVKNKQQDGGEEELYAFQPLWVSSTQLKSLVDTLRKLLDNESPLVIPTQLLRFYNNNNNNNNGNKDSATTTTTTTTTTSNRQAEG